MPLAATLRTPQPHDVPSPEGRLPADPNGSLLEAATDTEHARAAWPWLRAGCAPSTWETFVDSIAVRHPEVLTWPS